MDFPLRFITPGVCTRRAAQRTDRTWFFEHGYRVGSVSWVTHAPFFASAGQCWHALCGRDRLDVRGAGGLCTLTGVSTFLGDAPVCWDGYGLLWYIAKHDCPPFHQRRNAQPCHG